MHSSNSDLTQCDLTNQQVDVLQQDGFTTGLAKALGTNIEIFPKRFWVVDNSSSMEYSDGHRIELEPKTKRIVDRPCTRWDEIRACVSYHSKISEVLRAPTEFRLLNKSAANQHPQKFTVGMEDASHNATQIKKAFDNIKPHGLTPLTQHILYLQAEIKKLSTELNKNGQKVVIVLATDGLPVDGTALTLKQGMDDFVNAMRTLEGLPVWIVIRLCTDEDKVVSFYNDLDDNLELSVEVLDDFYGEAKEIYEHNKWLNYTHALHRTRELGFHDRVFDLIDQRSLTKGELRQFLVILFGESKFDSVPDPSIDWMGFVADITRMVQQEEHQWDPIRKALLPIINIQQLNKAYGPAASCSCAMM